MSNIPDQTLNGTESQPPSQASTSFITPDAEETGFKVYRPPNSSNPGLAPLPDDYFTMTSADIKVAQATLSARTNALVNAPLQVRAIREASEQAKRDRWPKVCRINLEKYISSRLDEVD